MCLWCYDFCHTLSVDQNAVCFDALMNGIPPILCIVFGENRTERLDILIDGIPPIP